MHAAIAILGSMLLGGPGATIPGDTAALPGNPHAGLPVVEGPGTVHERAAQLVGDASPEGFLLRSASSLLRAPAADTARGWRIVEPRLQSVWNSDIPYSANYGGMWAGRGWSSQLRGGLRYDRGPFRIILAPELSFHQNRAFDHLAARREGFSRFGSPWNLPSSIDLPQRFGTEPFTRASWGETSVSADLGRAVVGAATEQQWWGPGARNAIVMSTNAPGFPHVFARTARPLATRAGPVEAKWVLGALSESPFFDGSAARRTRAFNGVVLALRPAVEPNLTLGVARGVYASLEGTAEVALHGADFLVVGNARSGDGDESGSGADQISSLFARWLFPGAGMEVYGELARQRLPGGFREVLLRPYHSQGYTVGLQWAGRIPGRGVITVNPEATFLEQSGDFTQTPLPVFYRSETVPQGYTHRGQVLGASIGPGSSQWVSADYGEDRWGGGLFVGRIRWDNDAYYTSFIPRLHQVPYNAHDVSTLRGIRAYAAFGWGRLELELTDALRRDFLFQNQSLGFVPTHAVDVRNRTLRVLFTPGGARP